MGGAGFTEHSLLIIGWFRLRAGDACMVIGIILRLIFWAFNAGEYLWAVEGPFGRTNGDKVLGHAFELLSIKIFSKLALLAFVSIFVVVRVLCRALLMSNHVHLVCLTDVQIRIIDQPLFARLALVMEVIIELVICTGCTLVQFLDEEFASIQAFHASPIRCVKVGILCLAFDALVLLF